MYTRNILVYAFKYCDVIANHYYCMLIHKFVNFPLLLAV